MPKVFADERRYSMVAVMFLVMKEEDGVMEIEGKADDAELYMCSFASDPDIFGLCALC
jgi:hypothetical protein